MAFWLVYCEDEDRLQPGVTPLAYHFVWEFSVYTNIFVKNLSVHFKMSLCHVPSDSKRLGG